MRKILLAFGLLLASYVGAMAQCNGVFANNTACGNVSGGSSPPYAVPLSSFGFGPGGTSGQIQYNNSGAFAGFTAGGDCAINTSTGTVTCLKTNGTAFGPFATGIDATNLINHFNGGINASAGTFWRGDGTWASGGRPVLTGSTTYELSMSGNDANDCSTISPCLSFAHLWSVLSALDLNSQSVTIEIDSGSIYTYCMLANGLLVGQAGYITITSTSGTATVEPSSSHCSGGNIYALGLQNGARVQWSNLALDTGGTQTQDIVAISHDSNGNQLSGVTYGIAGTGSNGSNQITVTGTLVISNSFTLSGNAQCFIDAGTGAVVQAQTNGVPNTIIGSLSANLTYSTGIICAAQNANVQMQAIWWQGNSASGYPVWINSNGVVNSRPEGTPTTSAGGVPYFPGTVTTTATGTWTSGGNTMTVSSASGMYHGAAINGYLAHTCTYTSGSNQLSCGVTTGWDCTNGNTLLEGPGIPGGTYCTGTSGSDFTMSENATANETSVTVIGHGTGISNGCWIQSISGTTVTLNPDCAITSSQTGYGLAFGGLIVTGGQYNFLLKRDVDPASNDNIPFGLNYVA